MIKVEVINNFTSLTGYPLVKFISDADNFFSNQLPSIINFYKGNSNTINIESVKTLKRLNEEVEIITNFFFEKKGAMNTVDYWELLDKIEDVKSRLQYCNKLPKYLRSSLVDGNTKSGFVFEYTMSNQDTMEGISQEVLEESNYNNSWVDQAISNDLKENDWDIAGGKKLNLRKALFQSDLVTSMIDYTIGERIYGLDIQKRFEFEGDDLKVLNHKDTVYQCASILSSLTKGDIPEFKGLGMDSELYRGANFSHLNYPSIVREMRRNFASDDLFSDFEIIKLDYNQGDIEIEYKVKTKYELVIIQNVSL